MIRDAWTQVRSWIVARVGALRPLAFRWGIPGLTRTAGPVSAARNRLGFHRPPPPPRFLVPPPAMTAKRGPWGAVGGLTAAMTGLATVSAVVAVNLPTAPPAFASTSLPDESSALVPRIVASSQGERVTTIETVEIPLASESVTTSDRYLPVGLRRVVSMGSAGVQVTTYSVTSANGVEVERVALASFIITEPINDVVAVGTLEVPDRGPVVAGSNRAIGQRIAAEWGWTGIEWRCLDNLFERESNWRHLADNPSSSAYGIPQALPGSKMASAGADWLTNPATQITWGLGYIKGRYGSPCYAWGKFSERSPHWY